MVKKLLVLLFSSVLVLALAAPALAQTEQAKPAKAKPEKAKTEKAQKQDRWEGSVTVVSAAKSTLTVRKAESGITKTVLYDAGTRWVSQEHGSKTTNTIDASQVKEGDRVICLGTFEKDGSLHATLISKRLTPSLPVK